MTENTKKLLELASNNKELAKELQEANKETLIRLAKAHGIELTEEDFANAPNEVSDDELDAVAGGSYCICALTGVGSGSEIDSEKTCACVFGGGGQFESGDTRCFCPFYGQGEDGCLF